MQHNRIPNLNDPEFEVEFAEQAMPERASQPLDSDATDADCILFRPRLRLIPEE